MKVTRKDGETTCALSQVERAAMERSHAVLEQLAYHYRKSDFGDSMQRTADRIDALLMDKEVVPVAGDEESEAESEAPLDNAK